VRGPGTLARAEHPARRGGTPRSRGARAAV